MGKQVKINDFLEPATDERKFVQAGLAVPLYDQMTKVMANRPKKLSWQKFIEAACHAFIAENAKKSR